MIYREISTKEQRIEADYILKAMDKRSGNEAREAAYAIKGDMGLSDEEYSPLELAFIAGAMWQFFAMTIHDC